MANEMDLDKLLNPAALTVLQNPDNWSQDFMPEKCALCHEEFSEEELDPPFILWGNHGRWAIQFHMKCAFKDYRPIEDIPIEDDE